MAKKLRSSCSRSRAPFSGTGAERDVAQFLRPICSIVGGIERSRFRDSKNDLSPLVQIRAAHVSQRSGNSRKESEEKKNDPSIHRRKGTEGRGGRKGKEREEKGRRCARVALIRPSASLSPSSCTVPVEYRLSVVRLGVLRSSKYLGIFEEARVPKKTVYFVGKEGSFPGEAEQAETGAVFY